MTLTPDDISNLMSHYMMTKKPSLGIFGHDTFRLSSLGLIVPKDDSSCNRPLTSKGLVLAQLIIDYANEV